MATRGTTGCSKLQTLPECAIRNFARPQTIPSDVSLSRTRPSNSKQKTDRTGFIENEAFQELRRFAEDALEWMAHLPSSRTRSSSHA